MIRRFVIAAFAGAALAGLVPDAGAAGGPVPPDAEKLKPLIRKLYGKVDFANDMGGRQDAVNEIQLQLAKEKDRKNSALKYPTWWSEQIQDSLYAPESKFAKSGAKTKSIEKGEFIAFHGGREVKGTFFFRGPNGYSPKKSCPMLLSIVEAKGDPKAHIEKTWAAAFPDDLAKEWLLVAVADADAFDVTKDPISAIRILSPLIRQYNIDPNRIFIEGVGAGCKAAQHSASIAMADRLAGLILRNPQEPTLTDNAGLYHTAVVHGPEGADKAKAAAAKFKTMFGEARVSEIAAPDVASVEGPSPLVADWLKAAKPRELAKKFTWVATYDKDNACPNPSLGPLKVLSPARRAEVTRVDVEFKKAENVVNIQATNLGEFVVCMNDDLVDLDREVAIFVNGERIVSRTFERSVETMLFTADDWVEYGQLFPAKHQAVVVAAIPAADKKDEKGGDKKGDGGKDAPPGGDKK